MAERAAELVGGAGGHGTEHGVGVRSAGPTARAARSGSRSPCRRRPPPRSAARLRPAPLWQDGVAWPGAAVKRGWKGPRRRASSAPIAGQRLAAPPLWAAGLTITATFKRSSMAYTDINWQQFVLSLAADVARERLLDLIQVLRRHRHPVSGAVLADATGVSLRTLYRDIETLKAAGRAYRWRGRHRLRAAPGLHAAAADVQRGGDRGAGAGLALGAPARRPRAGRSRRQRAGQDRRRAARGPARDPRRFRPADRAAAIRSRRATRSCPRSARPSARERKLGLSYRDKDGVASRRTIWPFAVGFFEKVARGRGVVRAAPGLSATSAPTASPSSPSPTSAIRAADRPCSRSGASVERRPKPEPRCCHKLTAACFRLGSSSKEISMSRNWLAVASAEHVQIGRSAGFMQVCHGKASPLRRIQPGDRIVYYSPNRLYSPSHARARQGPAAGLHRHRHGQAGQALPGGHGLRLPALPPRRRLARGRAGAAGRAAGPARPSRRRRTGATGCARAWSRSATPT